MCGISRRRVLFMCVALVIVMIITIRSQVKDSLPIYAYQKWLLSKSYDGEEAVSNTTTYTASSNALSTATSTPPACASKNINFYELYNKTSLVDNATLYVTSSMFFIGRLGNQMFKYASILGLVRAQGRRMFIVPNTRLEETFKLSYVSGNHSIQQWPVVYERDFFNAKLTSLPLQNVAIHGYLLSFWYFAAVMDEVRQEFTFRDSVANDAAKIIHDVHLKYNSAMTVGVHVRRGDFLIQKSQRRGYGVPEKSYFMKSFSLMKSKFPGRNITFLVASDDLPWCVQNLLRHDVAVMPPASPSVHMAVLSSCDHVIISGGSFGWWSGWLANGYVIYYTGYMASGTALGNWTIKYQYYPRLWIGMGN